jgi:uncharacterized protein (TIGR02466 family)
MEAYAHFPSYIYRDEKPEWVPQLRDSLAPYLTRARDHYPPEQQPSPMVQTEMLHEDRAFETLISYLYEASVSILQDQGYFMDKYEFVLSALWGQSIIGRASTDVHVHKNSQLSGWIFIDTPENGAYPIFKDPRHGKAMTELDYEEGPEIKVATNTVNFSGVQPGTILIANSWLPHQIIGGGSDKATTSIHFIVSCREKGPTCCIQ